jgi:hypothetical protein
MSVSTSYLPLEASGVAQRDLIMKSLKFVLVATV